MSSSFYDVIVVGTDLSGLVYAAGASKRGYRVLVLGHDSRSERYDYAGYSFWRRPQIAYDLSASPAAEKALVDIGLNIELRNRMRPTRPRYQFVSPSHRFDFDADPTVLSREIEREFPGETGSIERYLRTVADDNLLVQEVLQHEPPLPAEGFRERRQLRRDSASVRHLLDEPDVPFRGFSPDSAARAMLAAPLPFLGVPGTRNGPRIARTRAAAHAAQGFQVLSGGGDELSSLLIDKVVAHCGTYRPEAAVGELEMSRGKVVRVGLRGRSEGIGCRLLVCNTDPKALFALIPHEVQKERFHHALRSLQPSHFQATWNGAVAGEVVEEGMGPVVFWVADPREPMEEANLVLVTQDPEPREDAKGRPYRVVTASCLVGARRFSPRLDFGREVADELRAAVARLVPFLDERLLASHLTWLPREEDARELDMAEVLPHYSSHVDHSLETSPLSLVTGYKNILIGGDVLFSGLGLEGAFVGGRALLRRTAQKVVLKSVLHA